MKKLINDPADVVRDALLGIAAAHTPLSYKMLISPEVKA